MHRLNKKSLLKFPRCEDVRLRVRRGLLEVRRIWDGLKD